MAKQQCLSVITEPSEDAVKVDRYVSAPLIGQHPAEWQQIGGYAIPAFQLRTPANAPGVLRNDVVGQLLNRWNAPSTIWWAREQGSTNPLTGGAVNSPLPSYSAQVMNTMPPAQNRAAFTAAVQRFLATRGNRANG